MDAERLAAVSNECTAFNLRKATRAVGKVLDQALAPTGLRGTQFTLLVAVGLAPGAPMHRLAEHLGMDRTTLTRNLSPLERDGLVQRAPGSDRRVRRLKLTDKGARTVERVLPLWEKTQRRLVADLGKARWKELIGHLRAAAALT
jgi:DNA-binding MarR family transcriptional regulator